MPAKPQRSSWTEEADTFEPLPTYMELAMAAASAHEAPPAPLRPRLPGLSIVEKLVAVGIVCLAFYGMALIGCGLFLKAEAKRTGYYITQRIMSAELQQADFDTRFPPRIIN
ncbi:sortase [Rhizobium sp. 768_B6_N1_8]|jgi:sortase A|uniref:sortase n=1 Tax=unclassified Rhizobium TaxID=2613769 RepID=UPI003F267D99